MAFAAWFGLLATALNLFPVGQLDGGHISYAVLGRRSTYVTIVMVVVAIALTLRLGELDRLDRMMVVMLFVFGPRHPRTFDEDVPLDRARRCWRCAALIIFALCFTPAPISPFDLLGDSPLSGIQLSNACKLRRHEDARESYECSLRDFVLRGYRR